MDGDSLFACAQSVGEGGCSLTFVAGFEGLLVAFGLRLHNSGPNGSRGLFGFLRADPLWPSRFDRYTRVFLGGKAPERPGRRAPLVHRSIRLRVCFFS